MKRFALVLLAAATLAIAFAVLHLRVQPPDTAHVRRSGNSLRVATSRIAWAPRYLQAGCAVPVEAGRLAFLDDVQAATAEGEIFTFEAAFRYAPPATLPADWPAGTWCESLESSVASAVEKWLGNYDRAALLNDPREAGWNGVQTLTLALRRAGITAEDVSLRPRISDEVLSTRAIPEIESLAAEKPPVILLALDGGDWQYLDHLIAQGAMPNLRRLIEEGARGVAMTEHPALSPLLWTTMMTGVSPLEHGILDFTRFHPSSGAKEPITSDERKVPAIWNMATDAGKSVAVLGLWATYPAEPVHGTIVSDRFFTFLFSEENPPSGLVWPPWREPVVRQILNEVERGVGYQQLRDYLPWLTRAEYDQRENSANPYEDPVTALRRILVETELYDRIASKLIEDGIPNLSIVYLQGTDTIGHMFAPFAPPKQPEVAQTEYDRYHQVPELYFRAVDDLLGRYRAVAEKHGAVLMLVSDHGFHWFEGRPTQLSSFAQATAAKWHRQEGMYLLWGPGIAPAGKLEGGIRQVAATLAALTGLPRPGQTTERPLPGTPATRVPEADYRPHYEPMKPVLETNQDAADEEIAKLRALGYIGAGESVRAASGSAAGTRTAGSFNNQGLILREQGKKEEAIAAFEKAIEVDPNLASALWNLSDTFFARNELDRADELLARAFANGLPEGRRYLIGRAIGYQRAGQTERSLSLLDHAVRSKPEDAELRMFRGRYRVEMADCRGALEDFRAAQQIDPRNPIAFASAGLAANCLGDRAEAERNFRRSLELNPNQPQLRSMLGQ